MENLLCLLVRDLKKRKKIATRVFWNGKTKRCYQENSKVLEKALTHHSSKTVWCVPSHNLITDETDFKPACYRLAHTRRAQISAYQRNLDSTFSRTCDCIKGDNGTSMTAFLLGSLLLTTHEYGLSLSLPLSLTTTEMCDKLCTSWVVSYMSELHISVMSQQNLH